MTDNPRIGIIQDLYANFGRGNIPAILDRLTEDVVWTEPAAGPPPFGGTRRGRQQVGEFFKALGERAQPERFEPREFIAHRDKVIVFGWYRFQAKPTGKTWETDWIMVWTFRGNQISAFQIYKDSAAEAAAFAG